MASADPALVRLAHRVLWPGFTGTVVRPWLERALGRGLGGVVLFGPNLDPGDPGGLRRLTGAIHGVAPDALIGADEEGGTVTRLPTDDTTSEPGNAALGRVDDPAATERSAARIGRRLRDEGVDIDIAPDADVNVDPANPVIGVRSFGDEPGLVARHTAAAVRGLQSAGVAACAKHFPGHGDTAVDSHLGLPIVDLGLDELRRIHVAPFEAAIVAGVRAIMTAHIRVPALGPAPATLEPAAIGLLRGLGFDGIVVTDALDMAAIRDGVGMGRGAVLALQAGVDLLCVGNPANHPAPGADERDFRVVLDALVAALGSGELAAGRIEEAAARIDDLVAWRDGQPPSGALETSDGSRGEAVGLARRALDIRGDVSLAPGPVLVVDARAGARTLAEGASADRFAAALATRREVETAVGSSAELADRAASHVGEVVLVSGQPQSDPADRAVRDAVLAARPDSVLIAAGWPGRDDPGVRRVRSWGSGPANARAVAEALAG